MIGERFAGVFTGAVMHTPVEVTERAMEIVRDVRADCLVAIGGGSTTGLGKAIALRTDLPQIVLPTSYAGSEMTPVVGQTSGGIKTTQSSPKILPEIVIYDVDLTMTMPPAIGDVGHQRHRACGRSALRARPQPRDIADGAGGHIRTLAHALPIICAQPNDKPRAPTRSMAPWLSGICLGAVGMALHHQALPRWAARSICRMRRPTHHSPARPRLQRARRA